MRLDRIFLLVIITVVALLLSCGGGGGGGGSSSGSTTTTTTTVTTTTSTTTSTPPAANVLSVTVNGSQCDSSINDGYFNDPCVSVTVCTPNSSTCQAINGILLDTGSYGLRIFKQKLTNVTLSQVLSGSGSLAECVSYADGSASWGPVQTASIILGGEPAVQVPVQVIDYTFPTVAIASSVCPNSDKMPVVAGYNGILGIGPFVYDCGPLCAASTVPGQYFSCTGTACKGTTVPLSGQVTNPVALLPVDNNGVVIQLPGVPAGGVPSVSGAVVFGIGTQQNNVPSGVTTYSVDPNNEFTTIFNGIKLSNSFIDTGSNALFFPQPASGAYAGLLPDCGSVNSGFFCPSSTTNFSATITGASGSPTNPISFQVGNFDSLIMNASNNVFDDVGGQIGGVSGFDWGLPFYLGRNVFVGIDGLKSSLGSGPYFAY